MLSTAAMLALGFGLRGAVCLLRGLLAVAATLESDFRYGAGCRVFARAMRIGLVPGDVCESCDDIWTKQASAVVCV